MAQMDGAVSYSFWEICSQKNTGLQGSSLSCPRMTTGFGPFELPTRGLLQKGRDHSPPKICFEEPSFWLAHRAMGIHSAINIQITKQIGVGAQWVELSYQLIITRGMGERLTYGILARYRVVLVERLGGLFFAGRRSCTEDYSVCTAATISR